MIQNKGIAHSFVPEQRDMYESWVDFTVKDPSGKVIAESGDVKPGGELNPEAHSFTNRLVNKSGTLNDLHQVWDNRVVAFNNTDSIRTLAVGALLLYDAVRWTGHDYRYCALSAVR